MFDGIGDAIDGLFKFALFSLVVLLPLALWKACEVVYWLWTHVSITWN